MRRATFTTAGRRFEVPFATKYLIVRNKDATHAGKMYFTEADFDGDENYVDLPIVAANVIGEWRGPVETVPGSDRADLWFIGVSDSVDLEIVLFQRRG